MSKLNILLKWIFAIIAIPIIYFGGRAMILLLIAVQHFLRYGNFSFFEETFNAFIFAPVFISYFCIIGPTYIIPNYKRTFAVLICIIFILSSIYSFLNPVQNELYFWLNISNSIEFLGALIATWTILQKNKNSTAGKFVN